MFEGLTNWFENKWNNTKSAITDNAGDVLGTGAGAARILNRVANSDENKMQIAESQRGANDKELETDIQLIQAKYKDSFDYVAESGGFWTQNLVIPVVSFIQNMFGIEETAADKLDKAKELIGNAENEIQLAIDDHSKGLDHSYQHVLQRQIEVGGADINRATDNIFNVAPSKDPFTTAVNNGSVDGNVVDINQPAPNTAPRSLQFNYDGS